MVGNIAFVMGKAVPLLREESSFFAKKVRLMILLDTNKKL